MSGLKSSTITFQSVKHNYEGALLQKSGTKDLNVCILVHWLFKKVFECFLGRDEQYDTKDTLQRFVFKCIIEDTILGIDVRLGCETIKLLSFKGL